MSLGVRWYFLGWIGRIIGGRDVVVDLFPSAGGLLVVVGEYPGSEDCEAKVGVLDDDDDDDEA